MGETINRVRLAKIAGLLFSDQDGEVVSAARMIRRMFSAAGLSAHDFVRMFEVVDTREVVKYVEVEVDVGRERLNEIVKMSDMMLANEEMMAKHERRFIRSMRVAAFGSTDFEMTQRQAQWFAALFTKYAEVE